MKKLLVGTALLALVSIFPIMTRAEVDVRVGISIPLPPVIEFQAPPDVVVLPDTNDVYVAPGLSIDLFFWNGFWWRPWEGRWYRSQYYDHGWTYYNSVPRFYFDVDPYWRGNYQNHNWHGHIWNYKLIPHSQFQQKWKSWRSSGYWNKNRTWAVQGYKPKPQQQRQVLRQQRQTIYQQRPEVQQHQKLQRQQRQEQQRQPRMQQQYKGESHQQSREHGEMGEGHRR
ncbi:MAG: hypothetical protein AB2L12_07295 [Smithellaceae bacterium]